MEEKTKDVSLLATRLPSCEALAYLGDAVYSLYVRERLVKAGISHAKELNRLSLLFVTAERQASLFHSIEDRLTEEETDVYRRAHNHKGLKPPKHATFTDYRTATGFEALLGALHYTGKTERIHALLDDAHTLWIAEQCAPDRAP